jgi:hypothetical protein
MYLCVCVFVCVCANVCAFGYVCVHAHVKGLKAPFLLVSFLPKRGPASQAVGLLEVWEAFPACPHSHLN